jgi:hypothetical protein
MTRDMTARRTHPPTAPGTWPLLPPLEDWVDTFITLHMWTQVIGKIRLELAPFVNHSWGVPLYVTSRGLTTSPIPHGSRSFAIDFDFFDHGLRITTTEGETRSFPLRLMSVAEFYAMTMSALRELNLEVHIYSRPVEVVEAVRFENDDRHAIYDGDAAHLYWRALVQVHRVLSEFRARFIGKVSPVHFFWGGFDLAVTRFSGRTAPKHPGGIPNCAAWIMEEAYSHELSSAGFWPGGGLGGREEAAFYAYAYPQPVGFAEYPISPGEAFYHRALGEFILPYEAVRTASDPDETLLGFLQSTYEAAAVLAQWDRTSLEKRL